MRARTLIAIPRRSTFKSIFSYIFWDQCLKLESYVLGTKKLSSDQHIDLGLRSENIEFWKFPVAQNPSKNWHCFGLLVTNRSKLNQNYLLLKWRLLQRNCNITVIFVSHKFEIPDFYPEQGIFPLSFTTSNRLKWLQVLKYVNSWAVLVNWISKKNCNHTDFGGHYNSRPCF